MKNGLLPRGPGCILLSEDFLPLQTVKTLMKCNIILGLHSLQKYSFRGLVFWIQRFSS